MLTEPMFQKLSLVNLGTVCHHGISTCERLPTWLFKKYKLCTASVSVKHNCYKTYNMPETYSCNNDSNLYSNSKLKCCLFKSLSLSLSQFQFQFQFKCALLAWQKLYSCIAKAIAAGHIMVLIWSLSLSLSLSLSHSALHNGSVYQWAKHVATTLSNMNNQ